MKSIDKTAKSIGAFDSIHYGVYFSTNSLPRRRCCKPTVHCNKSRDPVDLLQKLCLRRKLRPALERLTN